MINNINDLEKIKQKLKKKMNTRVDTSEQKNKYEVLVCAGTGCLSTDSDKIREKLSKGVEDRALGDKVRVLRTGCFGFCKLGPIIVVYPEKTFYCEVKEEDVDKIINQHLACGQVVKELLYKSPIDKKIQERVDNITFFDNQKRIALQNCGLIDPEEIDEYIAFDGYFALHKVLTEYEPHQVIDIISESGLRGRGGGGFPTGKKMEYYLY